MNTSQDSGKKIFQILEDCNNEEINNTDMSLAVDDCEMDESEDIYMPPPPMSSRHSRLN